MWWDDPAKAVISEESHKALDVIIKDKQGRAIGLEKIGFFPNELDPLKYFKENEGYLFNPMS